MDPRLLPLHELLADALDRAQGRALVNPDDGTRHAPAGAALLVELGADGALRLTAWLRAPFEASGAVASAKTLDDLAARLRIAAHRLPAATNPRGGLN